MQTRSPWRGKQSLAAKLTNFNRLSSKKTKERMIFCLFTITRREMAEILAVSRESHHTH